MNTFKFSRSDNHTLSSMQVARAVIGFCGSSEGFICSRMSYMNGYRDAVKFQSTEELSKAIDNYCETNDICSFDYSEFEIVLLNKSRLMKIGVIINKTLVDDADLTRVLQRCISSAEPKQAKVYKGFFDVEFEKPREQAMCYLPPFFDGNGKHIGGGMPGRSY